MLYYNMKGNSNIMNSKNIMNTSITINKMSLFLMLCIFPLLVIPNKLGYFYFPRYIMLGVLAILCIPNLLKNNNRKLLKTYIPLILYMICILISSIKAKDSQTAWIGLFGERFLPMQGDANSLGIANINRFTGFSTIIFCVILFFTAYKTEKSDKFIEYMICCASIVGFIAILQHFGINIVPHEALRDKFPPYGTIGQHNFLATYTVFILPAAIYKFIMSKNQMWVPCIALIYSGLLVSTTRGAWIALGISMVIMCIYYLRQKQYRKSFIIVIAVMAIVTAILLPTNNGYLIKRLFSIPTNISSGLNLEDSAGSNRLYIWKQVVRHIPANWAFGVGPDNLIYSGIWLGSNNIVDKAHNIYLETAVTMGIPALIFYLTFLNFFLRPWKTDKGFMFFSMISTYLIQGFFNIDVIMVLPLFWIILGFSQANMEDERFIQGA